MLLCIDPGLRGCGVALFHGREVLVADYVKGDLEESHYFAHSILASRVRFWAETHAGAYKECFSHIIIEHPRIYPGVSEKNPNDLLDVVAVGAACGALLQEIGPFPTTVFPSEWKGTVKKSVMTERIKKALSPEELKRCRFTNKSDDSDMLDAVGIGLWHLGRLNKKVYPGASK